MIRLQPIEVSIIACTVIIGVAGIVSIERHRPAPVAVETQPPVAQRDVPFTNQDGTPLGPMDTPGAVSYRTNADDRSEP